MTYTKAGDEWRIIMQHNTSAGEDPQPVRGLRDGRAGAIDDRVLDTTRR